ncbi:hypothetical protein [Corynebacterium freiburgense]|uniref:hypothetical protein n=1 Tax=Corynebacterium freiburgense TaxID=556548 RepID=UPI000418C4F4|nr:hypothetical protein [Corynebacterium freiburgense]WJZ02790.1 hypothetical protein CFREI_07525 [Corynebacterium freiburgense]
MRALNLQRVAAAFQNIGMVVETEPEQLNILNLGLPTAVSVESGQLLVLASDWSLGLDNTPELQRELFFRINDFHRNHTRIKIAIDPNRETAVLALTDVLPCHPGLSDTLLEMTLKRSLGGLIRAAYDLSSQIPDAEISPKPTDEWGGL